MIDPSEIESRFAVEDGMSYMQSIFDEPSEEAQKKITQVLHIMEGLPPLEADFVELYYFRKLKQTDIASIFRCSQPTVCYRLQRATARIQFLLQMPVIDGSQLKMDLQDLFLDPMDVEIMLLMKETTCQSEVAKRMGVSQGLVRHRFIRSLNRMKMIGGYEDYVLLFDFIAANLNILREVQRSAGETKVTHAID